MIQANQPADPLVHHAARRLAWRCGGIVEILPRQEELPEAARGFYLATREDMEKQGAASGPPPPLGGAGSQP